MTGAPTQTLPQPRYEARTRPVVPGQGTLSRLDAVLPAVVTIRLRGGGPTSAELPKLPATPRGRPQVQSIGAHRQTPEKPSTTAWLSTSRPACGQPGQRVLPAPERSARRTNRYPSGRTRLPGS